MLAATMVLLFSEVGGGKEPPSNEAKLDFRVRGFSTLRGDR